MTLRGSGIDRRRYGSCVLWTLEDDLAGGVARRFADRVDLFFRSGETALVVDVRLLGLVDSIGAAALAGCREDHPGLRVVGRPACWNGLTVSVRRSLLGLGALPDLETALESALEPASHSPAAAEQRRHPRIPLQLPVELLVGGECTPAALLDICRDGVCLSLVNERHLAALLAGEGFSILGLTADPLGREIAGGVSAEPVPAWPVRAAAPAGLGASFSGSPPPV